MLGYSARGSVNGGETRASWFMWGQRGGPRQVLIDGDKTAGYRTAALLHRATPRRAIRWIVTAISEIKQEQLSMVVA